jgi:lysine 6-dehydrogenase
MGRAVVHDLARSGLPVCLLDRDRRAAARIARRYGSRGTEPRDLDARDPRALREALARAALVVNCAPYPMNPAVMEAALEAGCHYLDLGGLFHTTRRQLEYDSAFRRRGLLAVLGMGSAPGITNVLARAAADRLARVAAIRIYNGGADFTPAQSPLAFGFSAATVLDEFTLRPVVFSNGRFRSAAPRSGAEEVLFDVGLQRVHLSLHSEVATLPGSFRAKGIRDCSFKIAYDPAQAGKLGLLIDLGLADPRPGPRGVAPRDVLLDCLGRFPAPTGFVDDRDCVAVVAEGKDRGGPLTVRYDLTAGPQRRPPLSAVARDTGFAPAIVARMVLEGRIRERGVLPPERCVPVAPFLEMLKARGMPARLSLVRPG